jgi:hypothetical protein
LKKMMRSVFRSALPVLLLAGMGACYSVRPLETPAPAPGVRVVANLTEQGSLDLANQVGPRVREVEGVFAQMRADTLELSVTRVTHRDGTSNYWNGEPVAIPRAAVAALHERQIDTRRSVLLGAAITGGALLAAHFFGGFFTGESGGGGNPVPPQ